MKKAYSYIRFSTPEQRKGNSLERQLDRTRNYCAQNGLTLDESLKADDGYSAFRGTNIKKGSLGQFVAMVKRGEVPTGTALVIENLDRLSRQGTRVTRELVTQLTDAGIEVHVVSINRIFRADFENDLTDYIILGVESERSFKESKYKSERVGSAWKTKKLKATCDHAITPKVPGWLTAKTGQPIKVIPERAETVRKIFRLASMGLGARRIADRLTEDGDLAFGKAGWIISYIKKILANRATLGEYQPHKTVDGKRSFDGDTVLNYFPAVITQTQWDAVRKSIANKTANYGSSLRYCGGRSSEKVTNLFTGLMFDSTLSDRSLVYHYKGRGANDWEYLVTSYKSGQPSNRMRYDHFEKAFLGFLTDLDWRSVAGESEPAELKEKQEDLDRMSAELDRASRRIAKLQSLAQDPDLISKSLFQNLDQENANLVVCLEERAKLVSSIDFIRTKASTLYNPRELLAIIRGDSVRSNELRLRLRAEIRKRVERIDIAFNAEILSAPPNRTIANVTPGKGQIVAKVRFVNGVTKWAIFDAKREKAVLLS